MRCNAVNSLCLLVFLATVNPATPGCTPAVLHTAAAVTRHALLGREQFVTLGFDDAQRQRRQEHLWVGHDHFYWRLRRLGKQYDLLSGGHWPEWQYLRRRGD
jgi:hypothetical protein